MNRLNRKTVWILVVASLFLTAIPASFAEIRGPSTLWYEYSVTGSNRYPGGSVTLDFLLVNSGTVLESLDSVRFDTPWGTFADKELPKTLAQGMAYLNRFTISIPASQRSGNITMIFSLSARYQTALGWVPFNPASKSFAMEVLPNPFTLQRTLTSVQGQLAEAQRTITSLQSQRADPQAIASLQKQVTDGQSAITSLQKQLQAAQEQTKTAESQVVSFRRQLEQGRNELSDTQTRLASTQKEVSDMKGKISSTELQLSETLSTLASTEDQLRSYTSVYLPLAGVMPVVITLTLVAFHLRRKSAETIVAPTPLEEQPAPVKEVKCEKCGTENIEGSKFCKSCGTGIRGS
jgi:hypothetical protein